MHLADVAKIMGQRPDECESGGSADGA